MGNTHFDENNADYEQNIVNSLYLMFATTNKGPTPLEDFQLMLKQQPNIQNKQTDNANQNANLQHELNNVIKCLEHFEGSHTTFDVNVGNIFLVLEKIIQGIDPLDFDAQIFDSFNSIINKLSVYFSENNSLENRKEWQDIILKNGELVALIHNVFITALNGNFKILIQKLEANEKENIQINNKISHLEDYSKKQTNVINQVVSKIRSLPTGSRA